MASEFKEFLASLEPKWEDPHEFDWIKEKVDCIIQKN